jgi:hypothetical protein
MKTANSGCNTLLQHESAADIRVDLLDEQALEAGGT